MDIQMNNPETWYRKRYALGGGIIGGASGYGIAHLLKGSSLTKLVSALAGAGIGSIAGYQIGKNKDTARLSDVSVLKDDDTKQRIADAIEHRSWLTGGIAVPTDHYSDKSYEAGYALDKLIKEKGDKVTASDTANTAANNKEYTSNRLKQIEEYLNTSDKWEKASIFGSVYRNKRTNAIYDLGAYKRRLGRSVPQYDNANAYAMGIPYGVPLYINDLGRYLFGRSAHIPISDKEKDKLFNMFTHKSRKNRKLFADINLDATSSSYATPAFVTPRKHRDSVMGQVSGHEYNHIGSALIADNLLPSNLITTGTGMPESYKGYYSVIPAEVTQHIGALNQRYHRMTGDYVKDRESFFRAVKHLSKNIQDVDSEGRRSLQMLGGLYNSSKSHKSFERALQNYAELAPVLV